MLWMPGVYMWALGKQIAHAYPDSISTRIIDHTCNWYTVVVCAWNKATAESFTTEPLFALVNTKHCVLSWTPLQMLIISRQLYTLSVLADIFCQVACFTGLTDSLYEKHPTVEKHPMPDRLVGYPWATPLYEASFQNPWRGHLYVVM